MGGALLVRRVIKNTEGGVPRGTNPIRSRSREHTIVKKQNNLAVINFSIRVVATLIDTITFIRCRSTSRPTVNQRMFITGIFPWV